MPKPKLKMYCVVSREVIKKMGGNRGKMIAMGGHAYLHAALSAVVRNPVTLYRYLFTQRRAKICLVVDTEADLLALYAALPKNTGRTLVVDAGLTVFGKPTTTFIGVGPLAYDPELAKLKVFF